MDTFLIGLENTKMRSWANNWQKFLVKNYCMKLYKKQWMIQQIIINKSTVPNDIVKVIWDIIVKDMYSKYIMENYDEYTYKDVILECIYFGRLLEYCKKQGKSINYDPKNYYAFDWNNLIFFNKKIDI